MLLIGRKFVYYLSLDQSSKIFCLLFGSFNIKSTQGEVIYKEMRDDGRDDDVDWEDIDEFEDVLDPIRDCVDSIRDSIRDWTLDGTREVVFKDEGNVYVDFEMFESNVFINDIRIGSTSIMSSWNFKGEGGGVGGDLFCDLIVEELLKETILELYLELFFEILCDLGLGSTFLLKDFEFLIELI